jgi:16S rRNA (guanine527-N7)-methyltransferase
VAAAEQPRLDDAFLAAAGALGVVLDPLQRERLERYWMLLLRWNRSINLVARTDTAAFQWRHILDSLVLAPFLESAASAGAPLASLADLGSGGGLPGLVLACVQPERRVELIEPVGRKAAFLRRAAADLELARVRVHPCRADAAAFDPVDVITARAVAPLSRLLAWSMPHLGVGGRFLFLKGRGYAAELEALPETVHLVAAHERRLAPAGRPAFVIELTRGS